jgi:hypothetical protein
MLEFAPICIYLVISLLVSLILLGLPFLFGGICSYLDLNLRDPENEIITNPERVWNETSKNMEASHAIITEKYTGIIFKPTSAATSLAMMRS